MVLICRFSETISIAIGNEVSSSYKLQLPSAALSIPISPTPQLPSPGGREAVDAVVPVVLHQQPGPHSFMLPHRVNRLLSVVPHRRADRSCGSSTQLPISPSPPAIIPSSPSPQVPKSQVQEAGKLWMPWCRWCCTSSLVPTLLCCPTGSTGCCPLCPTGVLIDPVAAEAHWLQPRAASVKIDLQQPRSEANLYVKF